MEPTELKEPEAWQIKDHNLASLTNETTGEVVGSEKDILDKTIAAMSMITSL